MATVGRLNVNELKELYEDGRVCGDRGESTRMGTDISIVPPPK
jgi:hypothetical protein